MTKSQPLGDWGNGGGSWDVMILCLKPGTTQRNQTKPALGNKGKLVFPWKKLKIRCKFLLLGHRNWIKKTTQKQRWWTEVTASVFFCLRADVSNLLCFRCNKGNRTRLREWCVFFCNINFATVTVLRYCNTVLVCYCAVQFRDLKLVPNIIFLFLFFVKGLQSISYASSCCAYYRSIRNREVSLTVHIVKKGD